MSAVSVAESLETVTAVHCSVFVIAFKRSWMEVRITRNFAVPV